MPVPFPMAVPAALLMLMVLVLKYDADGIPKIFQSLTLQDAGHPSLHPAR